MNIKQQRERAARRARQQRTRAIAFGVVVILVLGAAGYLLSAAFADKTPPAAENTIDISADMGGFSQDEVHVQAGQPVTIRLTSLDNQYHSDGGGKHQWAVDELGVSIVAPPEGSNQATFTPEEPGTYVFYCDICCGGRANPTMQGKLVVEA